MLTIPFVFVIDFFFFEFRDKSVSGHSVTLGETLAVSTAEINGATAYEVSGKITFIWIFFCYV